MSSIAVAIKTAKETPRWKMKKGVSAKFTPIDDKWGIKIFVSEFNRDYTYNGQKLAHQHGLAPEIGEKFEVEIDGCKHYGYITECIVMTVRELFNDDYMDCTRSGFYDTDEYINLMKALRNIGISTCDMHWANVGWMPDDRFVAIDFGDD